METDIAALRRNIKAILAGFSAAGLDAVASSSGLPTLANFDGSLRSVEEARHTLDALWERAMRSSGDPLLPLWVGIGVPFGCYEVVDYLCSAGETLGQGLKQLERYLGLITPNIILTVGPDAITFSPGPGQQERLIFGLFTVGITLERFRAATGVRFSPLKAELCAPFGLDTSKVEEWLGAPCAFGFETSRLVFKPGIFDLPLEGRRPELVGLLERHASDLVKKRGLDDPLGDVRAVVRAGLEAAEIDLERVSRRLGMSERTLQRRLTDFGVTFQQLLDEERHAWSIALLADRHLAIGEVAFLLGYSEPSAFARAFKRWTGMAPSGYRRQNS